MADFLNHPITVGDVLVASGVTIATLIAFLLFVVVAVNRGWVK